MIWLGWRQQRAETLLTAAMLVLLAALLIPTGLRMTSVYDHDRLATCAATCGPLVDSFRNRFAQTGNLIAWLTLIPGVIGILLAAPFVHQLEQGTHRVDWTQSITRGRWIAGKLGLAVATALVAALVLTALVTWWRAPLAHIDGRINNSVYDSEGTVVYAYTLFALGLATAIGAVWRRTVPAIVAGLTGYFAARLLVDTWLRERLIAPVTTSWNVGTRAPDLDRAWVLKQYPTDRAGHVLPDISCPHGNGGACHPQELTSGVIHAVYQPAAHFWALQIRETTLFAGVAVVLLGFAAWWTHQRAT